MSKYGRTLLMGFTLLFGPAAARGQTSAAPVADKAPPAATGNPAAQARGSLDKELIRKGIRQHISEVRLCYEKELTKDPNLTGRVIVQFTIGRTGKVTESRAVSTSLGSPAVESCITKSVESWVFPAPDGGIVIVTYPFLFKPESPPTTSGPPVLELAELQKKCQSCPLPTPPEGALAPFCPTWNQPYERIVTLPTRVRLSLDPSGSVSSVDALSNAALLAPAVLQQLKAWRFPPQPQPSTLTVSLPFEVSNKRAPCSQPPPAGAG